MYTRIKEMEGKIESVEQMSIDSISKGNWNEQYSRKKNLKMYICEKRRGETTSYAAQRDK